MFRPGRSLDIAMVGKSEVPVASPTGHRMGCQDLFFEITVPRVLNERVAPCNMLICTASTWVLPVVLAVTLHEAAHGFVDHRLGDDTAYRLGRVTLNPLKHIDPFGTILMPAILLLLRSPFLFGYAKPSR